MSKHSVNNKQLVTTWCNLYQLGNEICVLFSESVLQELDKISNPKGRIIILYKRKFILFLFIMMNKMNYFSDLFYTKNPRLRSAPHLRLIVRPSTIGGTSY